MTETTWPREEPCEECGEQFLKWRPQNRFCKERGCQAKRGKRRWEDWRERQEAAGVLRPTLNQYQRTYRERTGYARDYELKSKYGITLKQWLAYLDIVDCKCEICGVADERLCVDHDHLTGDVRGAICRRCNRAIGQLGDTAESVGRALKYLERPPVKWPVEGASLVL